MVLTPVDVRHSLSLVYRCLCSSNHSSREPFAFPRIEITGHLMSFPVNQTQFCAGCGQKLVFVKIFARCQYLLFLCSFNQYLVTIYCVPDEFLGLTTYYMSVPRIPYKASDGLNQHKWILSQFHKSRKSKIELLASCFLLRHLSSVASCIFFIGLPLCACAQISSSEKMPVVLNQEPLKRPHFNFITISKTF